MRLLVAITGGFGHIRPSVAIADAWRRRGHDVRYAVSAPEQLGGQPVVGDTTRGTGGAAPADLTREFGFETSVVEPADLGDLAERLPPPPPDRAAVARFFFLRSAAAVPFIAELAAAWQPDVILRDTTGYDAWAVGELLDVPVAGFDFAPVIAADRAAIVGGEFEWFRTHFDLPPDPELKTLDRWLTIVGAPPGWVESSALAATAHLVQPPEPDAMPNESIGDLLAFRTPGRPLVYVSFGTVFNTPELFQMVFDAVADLDVDMVATLGHNNDPGAFSLPANVRVTGFVSQSLIFPACDAVVLHGGYGSTMGALRAARPVVCVPLFPPDNRYNAARLVDFGAGIAVHEGDRTPANVRDAIKTVLADDSYRRGAAQIAAGIAGLPPVEHGAALLERLASKREPILS